MDSKDHINSDNKDGDREEEEEEEEVEVLPGFRFHPTDEELVGFYLRRKLDDKKPFTIELIKQIDIYKYDPWDLPKVSSRMGEKEWYFFCKRGRKYRNSIRPNRVTGSGFWKATGIDKPIYSLEGQGHDCIGLKKTLVYYSGSAGKGTKTDWMMHEFRFPSNDNIAITPAAQEAEIWTLCRIFKRSVSHRKFTPEWRELSSKRHSVEKSTKTCSVESNYSNQDAYINFGANNSNTCFSGEQHRPVITNYTSNQRNDQFDHHHAGDQLKYSSMLQPQMITTPSPSFRVNHETNESFNFNDQNWDELRSVVQFALGPSNSV